MAKKALTQDTTDYENITPLDPIVEDQATTLQPLFDKGGKDQQTFMNATLLPELALETEGLSGAHAIGLGLPGIAATNSADGILEVQGNIASKQDTSNLVTAFQVTPDDTHYPSEKLVKESLDAKADTSDTYTKSEVYTKAETQAVVDDATFNNLSREQQFLIDQLYDNVSDIVYNVDDTLAEQEYFSSAIGEAGRVAREESTYDGNGRLQPFVYKVYDTDGTTIIAQKQFNYTYDVEGKITNIDKVEVI